MNKYIILLALYFVAIVNVSAAPYTLPTVVISSDKISILPGESIKVTASIANWDEVKEGIPSSLLFSSIRLNSKSSYDVADNSSPYEWIIQYPADYSGVDTYKATVLFGKDYISSNELVITVKPDLSAIKRLKYLNSESVILAQGDFEQLQVVGLFSDGQERNLTLTHL